MSLCGEPTAGLDPRSRLDLWATIRLLVAGGSTVLLTPLYLEEADHLADRIVVIDRGRIIAEGHCPGGSRRRWVGYRFEPYQSGPEPNG